MVSSGSMRTEPQQQPAALPLKEAVRLDCGKILNPKSTAYYGGVSGNNAVLVVLAAGRGSRFGQEPKCIQRVHGTPLARHAIDAFRRVAASPAICIVGYRHNEVAGALGADNIYVRSDNPTGGTAYAAAEAFSVPDVVEKNPILVITMGDRVVPSAVFRRLVETHCAGEREADLTFLTAQYEPPKNHGKGRVLRAEDGRVLRIVEQRDIDAEEPALREALLGLTEGNCPLYVIRALTLQRYLQDLTCDNAQGQYYLTDIVGCVSRDGGDIRTVTTTVADPEYDVLCSDVTQPRDLALLEGLLASNRGMLFPEELEAARVARGIASGRPPGQVGSIARQLSELALGVTEAKLAFQPDRPVAIGVSGGRLRIAFMHPDMIRFFGPAWQMPIGAGDATGDEQIIVLAQSAGDGRIHLYPLDPKYRESVDFVRGDDDLMYPGENICDLHAYEEFGTRMTETLLLSLGYFSDEELDVRRKKGLPLPPPSLWVGSNMRRPFALVGNAIASMRTLRGGNLGARVQEHLGRRNFKGLRLVTVGNIPQGGFSSSSAVTVATKNAINALFDLEIPPDLLVHLACQAEYGTGVRAGSLDQATEQKGQAGQGTLVSSNPKDNFRVIGTYPVPADRFQIVFPFTVERDRMAWRWSRGIYGESTAAGPLTTGEARKMTGKATEIAALLTRLPLDVDFFSVIEDDLVSDGLLDSQSRAWICSVLRQLPLLASQEELRRRALENREWYVEQLMEFNRMDRAAANDQAEAMLGALFSGWRDPVLRGKHGVPLRAVVAYLFGEVAKNFYLIHHPEEWIEYVTLSQRGDCCFGIDPGRMPCRADMERELDWERGISGADLMEHWLERYGAEPFDYNQGLDDESLGAAAPPDFHRLQGSNFFRGLALIDLAEAMLKRAFGGDAVAVRVNAAGQGDYFQVHVDTQKAQPRDVKRFLRLAFYRRFGLSPSPEFVQLHPGGGAVGVRLSRFDTLGQLVKALEAEGGSTR